jgi:hypothetical protein
MFVLAAGLACSSFYSMGLFNRLPTSIYNPALIVRDFASSSASIVHQQGHKYTRFK